MATLLTRQRTSEIISRMGQSRIIILGDVMLDHYIFGSVNRISPEGPVPVVEVKRESVALGGAANVGVNVAALGDTPLIIGVVGTDSFGDQAAAEFREAGISPDYLVRDSSRQTTMKTRVMAESQQVARIDREDRHEISPAVQEKIIDRFRDLAVNATALVISDYGKGVITKSLLEALIPEALSRGLFIAVDPKETHFMNYVGVSLITPNHHEAAFASGKKIAGEGDLRAVGENLLNRLSLGALLITRGSDGMALFERTSNSHITMTLAPTFARRVFDVTGAGDTVIASFVSAVAAGASLIEATVISNAAAGIVVGEIGAASVSRARLEEELLALKVTRGA